MSKLLAGRHVLVVEDEMLIVMMIEDMLADLGCEAIVTAASVDQALAKIEAHVFDIAMLDANLAGMSSEPIADVLAARNVPFFFATGQIGNGLCKAHPNRPVLKKPFHFEALRETFRQALPQTLASPRSD
jgi:CheY-like chemotaxis protein